MDHFVARACAWPHRFAWPGEKAASSEEEQQLKAKELEIASRQTLKKSLMGEDGTR
jgi:hypothetical protein